jgi:phenylpyruvate tautomerase PptA (4-oxalocrotonate tautomerase family)
MSGSAWARAAGGPRGVEAEVIENALRHCRLGDERDELEPAPAGTGEDIHGEDLSEEVGPRDAVGALLWRLLHEHALEHLESRHGPGFTLVEATVFPGRSAEAKKQLFAAIARNLEAAAGVDPADVLVVLHEPPLECWGIRGGKPATEVAIGFKLDV